MVERRRSEGLTNIVLSALVGQRQCSKSARPHLTGTLKVPSYPNEQKKAMHILCTSMHILCTSSTCAVHSSSFIFLILLHTFFPNQWPLGSLARLE